VVRDSVNLEARRRFVGLEDLLDRYLTLIAGVPSGFREYAASLEGVQASARQFLVLAADSTEPLLMGKLSTFRRDHLDPALLRFRTAGARAKPLAARLTVLGDSVGMLAESLTVFIDSLNSTGYWTGSDSTAVATVRLSLDSIDLAGRRIYDSLLALRESMKELPSPNVLSEDLTLDEVAGLAGLVIPWTAIELQRLRLVTSDAWLGYFRDALEAVRALEEYAAYKNLAEQ
jgi:hypothetical protein